MAFLALNDTSSSMTEHSFRGIHFLLKKRRKWWYEK
jgi:hypothetical protein